MLGGTWRKSAESDEGYKTPVYKLLNSCPYSQKTLCLNGFVFVSAWSFFCSIFLGGSPQPPHYPSVTQAAFLLSICACIEVPSS